MTARRMLSVVAGVSLVYDLGAGVLMLLATDSMASWFGVPPPDPILFARLNGLFLVVIGVGYAWPLFRPQACRWYLWLFGVALKGGGAAVFVVDHVANRSPTSFLVFAVTDGCLAAWTLAALLRTDAVATTASTASRSARLPG